VQLKDALARPESYPRPPTQVIVKETHISWVFLAGEFAYKLKKPLVLDFLDYGSPARRRQMCEEEVRLNRRLAPDLYLGVRGVALDDGKAELTAPEDARAVDFVVEMRRYDERETLASRLARGELSREHVRRVGKVLAGFHARAEAILDVPAPVLAVERRFEQNLHELLALVEQRGEIGRVQALERFAHAFVTAHARMLQRRVSDGWIREGHGDLRAEHVVLDGEVQIVDCVEFDPGLRRLDVADDLAFLFLDLAARGAESLAQELVHAYREAGGDAGDDRLLSFYAAYRALVRAKVGLIRGAQLPRGSAALARESAEARDLIAAAERFSWRARLPLVIAVCGVPASGKTHLARALAAQARLPHLSSDLTRKRLAGVRATARAPGERYSADWNARTYTELGHSTAEALATSGGAIVDATFRHGVERRAFAAGLERDVPILFVECLAPRSVLAARAARRDGDARRISDADLAVVLREAGSWEALDEISGEAHVALRTDRPIEAVAGDVLALLDRRLAGGELPTRPAGCS
jgi:uncharacterized protein